MGYPLKSPWVSNGFNICLNTTSWSSMRSNESNDLDDLGGTPVFRKPPYAFMNSL